MQTKKESLEEAISNTIIGMLVALGSQLLIFPLLGIYVSIETNIFLVVYFTAISIIRSYVMRRYFNKKHRK